MYQKFEKISTTIKKRQMAFYGQIRKMEPEKVVNKIHTFQEKRKHKYHGWIQNYGSMVHQNLEKYRIREVFRKKIEEVRDLSKEKPRRTKRMLSEEERAGANHRMKEYWLREIKLNRKWRKLWLAAHRCLKQKRKKVRVVNYRFKSYDINDIKANDIIF